MKFQEFPLFFEGKHAKAKKIVGIHQRVLF